MGENPAETENETSMARIRATVALLLVLSLVIPGCVNRDQLKTDVLDAVRRHEHVRNYRFSGSLELAVPAGAERARQRSGLRALLPGEGTFSWQGVASFDPLRAEAEIFIAAPDRDPVRIPVFIQHNKLVFSLPGAGAPRRPFAVDLGELSGRRGAEGAPPLSESGARFAAAMAAFIGGIDAGRFDEPEELENGRRIVAVFREHQAEEFGRFWNGAFPAVEAALRAYLAGTAPAQGGAPAAAPAGYTLHEPVTFTFDLNEAGYLEQFRAEAHVTWQREDGSPDGLIIRLVSRLDDINADPPFVLEMPGDAVPLSELLNLLP